MWFSFVKHFIYYFGLVQKNFVKKIILSNQPACLVNLDGSDDSNGYSNKFKFIIFLKINQMDKWDESFL